MSSEILTTKVSTKGQVILPKAVRDRKHWTPGTPLIVEVTEDGVLLKSARLFPITKPEEVFGMLKYDGPPLKIEDFNEVLSREVKRRHARDRY